MFSVNRGEKGGFLPDGCDLQPFTHEPVQLVLLVDKTRDGYDTEASCLLGKKLLIVLISVFLTLKYKIQLFHFEFITDDLYALKYGKPLQF